MKLVDCIKYLEDAYAASDYSDLTEVECKDSSGVYHDIFAVGWDGDKAFVIL